MRVASFFPFRTTYYLNGHNFIEHQLRHAKIGFRKAHQKWKEIDHKTQRLYEQGLALFANHELKDGTRAGSKQISHFSKGFVDAIYAKLLVVEEEDADGNIVERERRRFANAAMSACRRAWFVGQRAQEKHVPATNPFSRRG
jgi:hypothetical protein